VVSLLDEIQASLYQRALAFREDHTIRAATYDEFKAAMKGRPGFVVAGWCGDADCEAQIKADTQATLRNIPFGSEQVSGTCIRCGRPSTGEAWFAKAY
jgi:prolyl-tRNA synthetase